MKLIMTLTVLAGFLSVAHAQNNSDRQHSDRGQVRLNMSGYTVEDKELIRTVSEDFIQQEYTDPATGVTVRYNLFIPKDYDAATSYPLVLFIHDAGPLSTDTRTTLMQGLGAISFASPEDQEKHPCFVLAPQYDHVILGGERGYLEDVDATLNLIDKLCGEYNIDRDRLYNTGQSMGCMTAMAVNIAHPELFAASFLVAGQWDTSNLGRFARKPMWIVVSEDDPRAYPGMIEACRAWKNAGATIAEAVWDGRADAEGFDKAVKEMLEQDADIRFVHFEKGSVLDGSTWGGPAAGHMMTWPVAYRIAGIRDWLFTRRKSESRTDSLRTALLDPDGDEIFVIAHRGDWHGTEENSIHAIQKAMDKGAQMAMVDLQRTADGEIILSADPSVSGMTLDEVRSRPLKEYRGDTTIVAIPTLKEALDYARGRILLAVNPGEDLMGQVTETIERTGSQGDIVITGGIVPPEGIMYMPEVDLDGQDALKRLGEMMESGPVAVVLTYSSDENPLIGKAMEITAGKCRICLDTSRPGKAGSHTDVSRGEDPDKAWGTLIRGGATMFITDQIKPFLNYLGNR